MELQLGWKHKLAIQMRERRNNLRWKSL